MTNATLANVKVGKIGSTYGIHGWLKIQSFTEFGASILEYQPWYLEDENGEWYPVTIEDGRIHGNGLVAKLPGVDTPEAARRFTGKTIMIERLQLPSLQKNEYYWSDLEGLNVINKDGALLGKVVYLMATGTNDVLVIKGEKEHAIPYLPGDVIVSIDLAKREIHVDWEPI